MISATVLAVIFVPVFFVVVRRIFKGSERPAADVRPRGEWPGVITIVTSAVHPAGAREGKLLMSPAKRLSAR
jgi:hypothetical protein